MTFMSFALQTFWMLAVLMTSYVADHTIALNTNTFSFHHYKHMCHVKFDVVVVVVCLNG